MTYVEAKKTSTDNQGNTSFRPLRKRQQSILHFFLFLICLGGFFLSFNRLFSYEDTITRSTFTLQGTIPVPVLKMQPTHPKSNLTAIIAHGFAGSKELMTGFGAELARAGVTAYLFDFPGHGQSSVPFPNNLASPRIAQNNLTALDEVVRYVRTHPATSQPPALVLLGHSMGSVAVGDYAMAHANEPDIITTILVSPVGQEYPTPQQPKNLLLLAGSVDLPDALSDSQRMIQEACGLTHTESAAIECGNPAHGTGRRLHILSGLNHLTILNASSTFQETLNWLQRTSPGAITPNTMQADVRLFWLLCGVACILLSLLPLSTLLADFLQLRPSARSQGVITSVVYNVCLLFGIIGAVGILKVALHYKWQPFGFIGIMLTDYVAGYFFLLAMITAAQLWLIRRTVPLPPLQQLWQQLASAAIFFLYMYIPLSQVITFAWERFSLTELRLGRFALVFLLLLPFFLLDESMNRRYQERRLGRVIVNSLISKTLLLGGLVISLILIPSLGFLIIILPILFLLFLLLTIFNVQFCHSRSATLTTALLSALMIAWCLSATLPIT